MANLKKTRPVVALLLSLIAPGLGQLYNGKLKRGIILFLLFEFLFILLYVFSGLCFKFYGFILFLAFDFTFLGFYIYVLLNAFRGINPLRVTVRKPYHRWYFYVAISAGVILLNEFILTPILPDIKRFKVYKFPSISMQPALLVGDRLVVDREMYKKDKPKRGDVIISEYPKDPSKDYLKRVIGLEGEKVEIVDNKVYIDDKLIDDSWGYYESSEQTKFLKELGNFGPVVVPKDSLFLLGDNRQNSLDSRIFGFVDLTKVKGKALYIYWAKNKSRIGMAIR
jgi:signal peptidase I